MTYRMRLTLSDWLLRSPDEPAGGAGDPPAGGGAAPPDPGASVDVLAGDAAKPDAKADEGDPGDDGLLTPKEGEKDDGKGAGKKEPPKDETPEQKAAREAKEARDAKAAEFHGAPEGDKYADYTLADGMEADPELKGVFDPIAAELGLSQKGAQKLVDLYPVLMGKLIERHANNVKQWRDECPKDKEFGGANFEANKGQARKALQAFASEGFIKELTRTGYSNHPEFVRTFYRIGVAMGEMQTENRDGHQAAQAQDAAQLLYGGTAKPSAE